MSNHLSSLCNIRVTKIERFKKDEIENIFSENEALKKKLYESISNYEPCAQAYQLHDEWFSDLGWRLKETKDVVSYVQFTEFTADQNRSSLMIHLNGLSYVHLKMMSSYTYEYYAQLNFKFDRLCEIVEFLGVRDLKLIWDKFNRNIEKICQSFTAFCVSIAHQKHSKFNLDIDDAYQLCLLGVLKAARTYRVNSTIDFIKYAHYFIHTELNRNRQVGECINIIADDRNLFQKIKEYSDCYFSKKGFYPTDKEITVHFNCKKNDVYMAHVYMNREFEECIKNDFYKKNGHSLLDSNESDNVLSSHHSFSYLYKMIEELEEPIRLIIKSTLPHYGEVMSQTDLANRLNISVRKIVFYRNKGLQILSNNLKDYGIEDFIF